VALLRRDARLRLAGRFTARHTSTPAAYLPAADTHAYHLPPPTYRLFSVSLPRNMTLPFACCAATATHRRCTRLPLSAYRLPFAAFATLLPLTPARLRCDAPAPRITPRSTCFLFLPHRTPLPAVRV